VALVGDLSEFQLAHIVGLLQVEQQTGILALGQDEDRVLLYFQQGAIVHARAAGQEGYDAALLPFSWPRGPFRFQTGPLPVEPTITGTNAAIVAAGLRRAGDMRDARGRVPNLNCVVRLLPQVDGAASRINLTFDDWRFLTLVDGQRDLRAIAHQLHRGAEEAQLLANRLARDGLLELLDPRQTMLRLMAMPVPVDQQAPSDPLTALMDDRTLAMLGKNHRAPPAGAQIEVLTATDQSLVLAVAGRPSLADRLLLSREVFARLDLAPNTAVHIRRMDDTS